MDIGVIGVPGNSSYINIYSVTPRHTSFLTKTFGPASASLKYAKPDAGPFFFNPLSLRIYADAIFRRRSKAPTPARTPLPNITIDVGSGVTTASNFCARIASAAVVG